MKRVQPGERISIRLTDRERKLILDHTFIDGDLERRIRVAAADSPAVVIALDLDDLEELLGHVAAAANHSKDPSVAKHLRRVHERLSRIGETYADAGEPLSAAAAEGPENSACSNRRDVSAVPRGKRPVALLGPGCPAAEET